MKIVLELLFLIVISSSYGLNNLYCILNRSLLVEGIIHISYMSFSIFFNLTLCFFTNSKLITSSVTSPSNNTSTITFSHVLILFNPIFTITFLNISLLFRSRQNVLSITLLSIANLLLLEPSQGLPDSLPHLNYCSYCLNCPYTQAFFPFLQFLAI